MIEIIASRSVSTLVEALKVIAVWKQQLEEEVVFMTSSNSFFTFIHHHDKSIYFKYYNGLWYDENGFNSSKPYPCNPVGSTHKLYDLYQDLVDDRIVVLL